MGSPAILKPVDLFDTYRVVRQYSEQLAAPLTPEDQTLQSMPDASPVKWHLAHTSWFFETFILSEFLQGYQPYHPAYKILFNSYYNQVGEQYTRSKRGLISRPDAAEIQLYRAHVDSTIGTLLDTAEGDALKRISALVELGLHHEQQHQELLLTDIKHAFSENPLAPVYLDDEHQDSSAAAPEYTWHRFAAGLYAVGHSGAGFCFDNERPSHQVAVTDYAIASRPVTNREYLEFVSSGAYQDASYWLSEGWSWVQENHIETPMYWRSAQHSSTTWQVFTLQGLKHLALDEPVTHISYFEADAFARWAGYRLPTEHEWEIAASTQAQNGQHDVGRLGLQPHDAHQQCHPSIARDGFFGDVWNWTSSAYSGYPGFRIAEGAVGEYNGKFMCNQYVLRGGSCVTPVGHIRATYRNFFPAHTRWQFSGLRLAKDA